MRDISARQRILILIDILSGQTDEDHGMSISNLMNALTNHFGEDYKVNRKTIKSDLDFLNLCGMPISKRHERHNQIFYSYQYRKFDLYELRIIIDALSSAHFITKEETIRLINKVKALTSEHLAKKLQNTIHTPVKTPKKEVKFFINTLHQSITENKKVTFQYGKYNTKKELVLHRDGLVYSVEPYALVWNSDYYYLIAKQENQDGFKHFRVDRMINVTIIEQSTFKREPFDISKYLHNTFHMYSGPVEPIVIRFNNNLINVVIDRFGTDIDIRNQNEQSFEIRFHGSINEGLIRWVLTWGSDAKVLSPDHLVQKIKSESVKMLNLYS